MILEPPDFDDRPVFALRGKQPEWLETILRDITIHSRLLVVAPGGVGKTTLFAALAARMWERGIRTLVLENRDRLTRQTADRIRDETGLDVDVEMANDHASPFAPVVVACVATLGRVNRLTGFSDSHFGLIVPDECHFSLAPQFQRILRYFHYGAASLDEEWPTPDDGTYPVKASVVGFTATPDIGEKKNLGQFYQHRSVDYTYLDAVNDGWLVRPVQKNIPLKIDLRKYKAGQTPNGNDFRSSDLSEALIPIMEELADQHVAHAHDKKSIAFLPSVECAQMMTVALNRRGHKAIFVSGECLEVDENTEEFVRSGAGTTMCNAVLYAYGVDFPDVDCIGWYRATLSRAFYIQGIYRGTRVLHGVVNGLDSPEDRKAAIAASSKPFLLILDPLFVSDRIDLLDAYDLFTDKPEVKAKMKVIGEPSEESAREAERDFIKALEKEARKHVRKKARTIDPLKFSLMVGDDALANYVPQTAQERRPPTEGQIGFLQRQRVDVSAIKSFGYASKLIGRIMTRLENHLASYEQLQFLKHLGMPEVETVGLKNKEASALIDRLKRERTG